MRWILTWVVVASLVAVSAPAQLTFRGEAHTEGEAEGVTVRVWAAGERLVADPALLFSPLAETVARPGTPFTLALPAGTALPVRLELDAAGHVAVCLEVLFREQATLPAAWLPRGEEYRLAVRGGGAEGRVVSWGPVRVGMDEAAPLGRFSPCVPRAVGRERTVWVAPRGWAWVVAVDEEGRWGRWAGSVKRGEVLQVDLSSRRAVARVIDGQGAPRGGVVVAADNAPEGAGRRTDAEGRAPVYLAAGEGGALLALTAGGGARELLRADPAEEVALVVRPVPPLEVSVGGPATVAWEAGWVPRALTGGPLVGVRALSVPSLGRPVTPRGPAGELRLWAPGHLGAAISPEGGAKALAVELKPAGRLKVRVTDAQGKGLGGVPLWGWRAPARRSFVVAGMAEEDNLVREWLPDGVSDASGWGVVESLPAGAVRASARPRRLAEVRSPVVRLATGEERVLTLRAVAGHPLVVAVQDAGGTPISGARVEVFRAPAVDTSRLVFRTGAEVPAAELVASADSDGEGIARVEAVPAGAMQVWVAAPGWVAARLEVTVPTDGDRVGPVVLRPGLRLRGRVVQEGGAGVAGAQVSGGPGDSVLNEGFAVRCDAEGWWEVGELDPGEEWVLRASAPGYAPASRIKLPQPPPAILEITLQRGKRIKGRVVATEGGDPVVGAEVAAALLASREVGGMAKVMTSERITQAEADGKGEFLLEGLPREGTITVEATAPSFVPRKVEVDLSAHDEASPLTLPLSPAKDIAGKVLGPDERPLPGVVVSCAPAVREMVMFGGTLRRSVSGPEGAFRCLDLAEGSYEVTATLPDGGSAREVVEAGKGDVVLRLGRPGAVEGRVLGEDGGPVAGARVLVFAGRQSREGASDETGAFRVDQVPAGEATVQARASGFTPGGAQVTVASGEVTRTEITLKRGGVVVGWVKGLSGDELRRCRITAGLASAAARPDGSFRLEGVAPGASQVRALVLPEMKIREAVVEVRAEVEAEVEFDFAEGTRLFGTVRRGGRPAAGLTVTATLVGSQSQGSTVTDQQGAWVLEGVKPGEVELAVLNERGEAVVVERHHLRQATRVDLEIPDGSLSGRVIAASTRHPIVGATVTLERAGAVLRRLTTDADGAFVARELATGEYRLRAGAQGYSPEERAVEVRWGVGGEVTVPLQPADELVLRVREADGSPARSVVVAAARGGMGEEPIMAACDSEGRARLATLPRGSYVALVQGQGVALVRLAVPSPELLVTLAPAGTLVVELPREASPVRLQVVSEELGEAVPTLLGLARVRQGWMEVSGMQMMRLPPGRYRVDVERSGQVRAYPVNLTPGAPVRVAVE